MSTEYTFEKTKEDYVQSANTLFHFMDKPEYLIEIICDKAILPRYCQEDIAFLNIRNEKTPFIEALVLEKCFCDIPLQKITLKTPVKCVPEEGTSINDLPTALSHTDIYGEYGIAFSKAWGERNRLQPVHYLNEHSLQTDKISDVMNYLIGQDEANDLYTEELIEQCH